jgi:hypothetical protein
VSAATIDHMIEVLGWVKENKVLQLDEGGDEGFHDIGPLPYREGFEIAAVRAIHEGKRYRLKPTPVRRPFTEKEAQRLVGCVLVSPEGKRGTALAGYPSKASWTHNIDPTFAQMANEKWHYHLPGQPDDLKPCWVEEEVGK